MRRFTAPYGPKYTHGDSLLTQDCASVAHLIFIPGLVACVLLCYSNLCLFIAFHGAALRYYHTQHKQQSPTIYPAPLQSNMSTAYQTTKITRLEDIIDYTFNDRMIAIEALNIAGSGTIKAGSRTFINGNKRLAILGDRIAEQVLCDAWYETCMTEEEYTTARLLYTSDAVFSHVGMESGLFRCMLAHPQNPVAPSQKILSTLVEAVFGAVWLDSGKNDRAVKKVIRELGLAFGTKKQEFVKGRLCHCGIKHKA